MDKTLLFIVNPRAGKTKSSAPLFDAVATRRRETLPGSPPSGAEILTWWCAPEETVPSTGRCRA